MKKAGLKLGAFLIAASCAAVAVGCGGRGNPELNYDFGETGNTVEYTFYSPNWEAYEGKRNDRVLQFLENKFNVKIKVTGSSMATWEDRLATEIADGETPDLFFTLPEKSTFTDYIRKQVITDLNPYIEKASKEENAALQGVGTANSLTKIFNTKDYKETTVVNGKNYFVPQSVGYTTRVMIARKDWVKRWNESKGKTGEAVFDAPEKLSEFTDMLKYFVDNNLGGGSQTFGMTLNKNWDFIQDMYATFGIQPGYTVDGNGDFLISAMQDNYKDLLNWFSDACSKNYVYPEFMTQTEGDSLQYFYQNRCGVVLSVADAVLDGVIYELGRLHPNEDIDDLIMLITPPDSDDGAHQGAFKGWNFFWGGWCVSADAPEPMRLVRMLDYIFSPEGQKLMVYGVKDVHYSENAGVIVPNLEARLAEGDLIFGCRDDSKKNIPDGRYKVGYQFNSCPYIIGEDNQLKINYPYDTAYSPAIMKQAYDLTYQTTPNFSGLRTIIADPDINDYNSLIQSSIQTYTYKVIGGASQTSEYATLVKNLEAHHYTEVLQYLNKNNKIK